MGAVTLTYQLATRGAPEGSVLGPVLLHIFFNDQVHSQKFAGDSMLCESFDLLEDQRLCRGIWTAGIDRARSTCLV